MRWQEIGDGEINVIRLVGRERRVSESREGYMTDRRWDGGHSLVSLSFLFAKGRDQ